MRFTLRRQKRTEELILAMSGDNRKNNSGLVTRIEKGLSEVFMFIFSVVLHLTHSLKREHGARL
jgi:hypothetical protein